MRRCLLAFVLLLLLSFICLAFSPEKGDEFDHARREVLLRRIGHELLLQSGDSTSRVPPVQATGDNEYLIRFEREFSFRPDSLVSSTRRLLATDPYAREYVVNVLNCRDSGIAYSYAISGENKEEIISCIGRVQPRSCYLLKILFKPAGISTAMGGYVLGGLALLALTGFLIRRSGNTPAKVTKAQTDCWLQLGPVSFDPATRKLLMHGSTTELTGTEARILLIFAQSPNQVIERSRLQKEIWEDEGVIVGRSLDMFISKLRKKLEPKPAVKIVAIRGKGYRLEIS